MEVGGGRIVGRNIVFFEDPSFAKEMAADTGAAFLEIKRDSNDWAVLERLESPWRSCAYSSAALSARLPVT
jgi:hypothetical protein